MGVPPPRALTMKQGLEGGPDPAFPLLFHVNPASLTCFYRFPSGSRFFFPKKRPLKKTNFCFKSLCKISKDWPFDAKAIPQNKSLFNSQYDYRAPYNRERSSCTCAYCSYYHIVSIFFPGYMCQTHIDTHLKFSLRKVPTLCDSPDLTP